MPLCCSHAVQKLEAASMGSNISPAPSKGSLAGNVTGNLGITGSLLMCLDPNGICLLFICVQRPLAFLPCSPCHAHGANLLLQGIIQVLQTDDAHTCFLQTDTMLSYQWSYTWYWGSILVALDVHVIPIWHIFGYAFSVCKRYT